MSLENWQVAVAVLIVIIAYVFVTASGTIRTMGQAGPPGSPQAALGQAAINGTIGCFAVVSIGLAVIAIIYLSFRQPALPFPGVALAFAPTPTPAVSVGREVVVVYDGLTAMRHTPGDVGKPQKDLLTYTGREAIGERRVKVVEGPVMADGKKWFRVVLGQYVGWLPEYLGDGSRVLAP